VRVNVREALGGIELGHPSAHPVILDLAHAADVVFENFRPAGAPSDSTFFFSFVYDTLGVPLAAGVLYPALGLLLSPIVASAARAFSSVSAINNALRLRKLAL